VILTDGGCVYARAQGEEVEYDVDDADGKPKAVKVTGPDGVAVKGAPRRRQRNRLTQQKAKTDATEPEIAEKAD
jgi:cold shock domain protein A